MSKTRYDLIKNPEPVRADSICRDYDDECSWTYESPVQCWSCAPERGICPLLDQSNYNGND